jgi:hypothetical protein
MRGLLLLLLLTATTGCEADRPRPEAPIAPTPIPIPTPIAATRIEYRVTGTHRDVSITYTTSTAGTTVVKTDLPWFVTYETLAPRTFVYVQADGSTFNTIEGVLIVQIFVDGLLFREARGAGLIPSVVASGEVVR